MVVFVLRLENIFVWCDHRLPTEVLWVPLCPTTTAGFWKDLPATVVVSGGVLCVDGSAVFVLATYRTFQDVSLYGDGFMMGDGTGVGVASGTTAGATCWGWLGGSVVGWIVVDGATLCLDFLVVAGVTSSSNCLLWALWTPHNFQVTKVGRFYFLRRRYTAPSLPRGPPSLVHCYRRRSRVETLLARILVPWVLLVLLKLCHQHGFLAGKPRTSPASYRPPCSPTFVT